MPDLLSVIEAAYAVEQDETTWLANIVAAATGHLSHGRGCAAFLYDASDLDQFRVWSYVGSNPRPTEAIVSAIAKSTAERVRWVFRTQVCRTASEGPDWATQPAAQLFRTWGVHDVLFVNGADPSGVGCFVTAPLGEGMTVPPALRRRWSRIAAHLAAGYRLQRRLAAVDAIVSPSGKIEHLEDDAKSGAARVALQTAVRAVERARGPLRRREPDEAIDEWKALVSLRWTLVDQFDSDGRRYVVARRNEPGGPAPAAKLTPREQQVLAYVRMGHSNKLVAYELGISPSTVGVLLSRAAAKLGARSRAELLKSDKSKDPD